MYTKRMWRAGKTIDVQKSYCYPCQLIGGKIVKAKRRKPYRSTPESMKKYNQVCRERAIIRLVNANFAQGDLYITLKYTAGCRPDVPQAKEEKRRFLRALRDICRKEGQPLRYVFTTEIGERGGIHHHAILGAMDVRGVEKLWKRATEGRGNLHFEFLYGGDFSKLAKYFVGERCSDLAGGKESSREKRYSTSQGLKRPQAEKVQKIKADSWRQQPTAPKGYYVDPDSVCEGINPVTGHGYQFYRLIKIEDGEPRPRRGADPARSTADDRKELQKNCIKFAKN